MAPFLTKLFVGPAPVLGIQKCLLWALVLLCTLSGVLHSANTHDTTHVGIVFESAAKDQLLLSYATLLVLALLLWVDYRLSTASFRTIIWDGMNPVGWLFLWLCLGGLVDNYTKFPSILVGVLAFVGQVVLVATFVRSSLRRR